MVSDALEMPLKLFASFCFAHNISRKAFSYSQEYENTFLARIDNNALS